MDERLDHWISRYAERVLHYRWGVLLGTVMAVALAAFGGRNLEFTNNYRALFSKDNPELKAFTAFQATYTKSDNILFVIHSSAEGGIFTARTAEAVEWLTAQAWKIPYAIRVDSVTNFQHSWAEGDRLTVEDLIRDAPTLPPAVLAEKRAVALAEPLLRGNLISPDSSTTGVNVTIQYPEVDNIKEVPEAVSYARRLVKELHQRYPSHTVALAGVSMLNNAFVEVGRQDALTLVPLMYVALIVMIALALRSLAGTLSTLLVITLASVTAMGLAGYLNIRLTPVSVIAPTIILTLSIADSIHLLTGVLAAMDEGRDKFSAVKESLRSNFVPVTVTSLTTVVGFLSLNFSDAPPFWHLGNITAMGIAAAWVLSVLSLPAFLAVLPLRSRRSNSFAAALGRWMPGLADFVIARRRAILWTLGMAALGLALLVPTVELDDRFVRYIDERVKFRTDADFATQHLGSAYAIEYSIPGRGPGGISDPEYLRGLEVFTNWLRSQSEISHVYSHTDTVKRLNRNMHGDDPQWYRLPSDAGLAAQYLLLYELSLPYGLDLNDRINIDKSATRVTATLRDISTRQTRSFLDRSVAWLEANTPDYMSARPTGPTVMFAYISERNIRSMLTGNVVAVLSIALILILVFRSLGLGLFSLLPNVMPILMTFGVWALVVGQVGVAAAMVSASSLGIIVDDTVHFLAKYLLARRRWSYSRPDAIRYVFRTVGPAIVVTTLALTGGFAVLAWSSFALNAQMGLLTAIAVLFALVTDLFLLPALLLIGYKSEEGKRRALVEAT